MLETRTEIEQIWPAHADHISYYKEKFVDELFKSSVVAQRKYDGERMLIHFLNGKVYCTSRRISKKTGKYQENQEKLANLPTLAESELDYTVIDCECYADTWSESAGVLHSLPERALELQKTVNIKFAVFDCLFFNGKDLRNDAFIFRRTALAVVMSWLKHDSRFHKVEERYIYNKEQAYEEAQKQWELDREGVVIKSLDKTYYEKGAMLKIKRFESVDVVVYDYLPGRGKYEGTVGALYVGYYDPETDSIKHVSKVNCGTDDDRDWWRNYFSRNAMPPYLTLEVLCQEITDKSLRHPRYIRLREDKDYHECTKETIFKE